MSFFARAASLQFLRPEARLWARECDVAPGWIETRAASHLYKMARDLELVRVWWFGAHEGTIQTCSLMGNEGSFSGPIEHVPSFGIAGDAASSFYDTGETFARIAWEHGTTPGHHGFLISGSTDTGGLGDAGASGGGTQCDIRLRSTIGTLAVRACNSLVSASVPNVSAYGAKGYFNIAGASYAVTRINVVAIAATGLVPMKYTAAVDGRAVNDVVSVSPFEAAVLAGRQVATAAPIPSGTPTVTVEVPAPVQLSTAPTAFWPTSNIRALQVGAVNQRTDNRLDLMLVVKNPSFAKIDLIDRGIDQLRRMLRVRDEVYAAQHQPPFLGPYPFTRGHLASLVPADLEITRIGQPPRNQNVTNTTFAPLITTRWILTPNASPSWDLATTDPFDSGVIIWRNRAEGEVEGQPTVVNAKGNNTYGAAVIPPIRDANGADLVPGGLGRPMYPTYDLANRATLTVAGHVLKLAPRADPDIILDGLPTGWLDIADRFGGEIPGPPFDTRLWEPIIAASADVATDPLLNVPVPATDVDPGTPVSDTGDLIHYKYAKENPVKVFNRLTSQGWLGDKRVVLPPHRAPPASKGGNRRISWLYVDDEADDGTPPPKLLGFYTVLGKLCHPLGVKVGVVLHALDEGGAARKKNGWTPEVNHLLLDHIDRVEIVVDRKAGDVAAFIDRQIDAFRGPTGTVPVPMARIGLNVVINACNAALLESQGQAINAKILQLGIKNVWFSPGGANFRSKWNDPVNLAQAAVLGISPTTLVGYAS